MNGQNKNDISRLAREAGSAIGTSEEDIISAAKSGDLRSIMPKLTNRQAQQLKSILSDEESAKKLLSSPEAQALIRRLSKK